MRKTEERGITLLVLIITILIMLILAGVVLNIVLDDNGIIRRAEEAANKYGQAQNDEIAMLNSVTQKYDNIINNSGTEDSDIPYIQDIQTTTSGGSITVKVTARNTKIYRYYYKKASEYNYTLLKEQSGNTYTIDGLTVGETYSIKVEAVNGEKKAEKEIEVKAGEIIPAEGNIRFGNLVWQNKKASISMSTNTEYDIQYQVNGTNEGAWTTGTSVSNLNLNDTVYARLWNGSEGGSNTSITVGELTPPNVNISIGQVSTKSIEVTASASDNESGMPDNPVYQFYIKESTEASFPSNPQYTGTDNYWTFRDLTNNKEYDIKVVTQDLAGNEGSSTSNNNRTVAISGGEDGTISFGAIQWQSDNTAKVAISTTTSYTIQYQINGTSEGNWTIGTQVDNLELNDMVYARLWDGNSAGTRIEIKVSDTVMPNEAQINITPNVTSTDETIIATVIQSDNQSGVDISACRWEYNTISGNMGTNANDYEGTFGGDHDTLNLTATTPGTYYLHVLTIDYAGIPRESKAGPVVVKRLVTGIELTKLGTPIDQENITLGLDETTTIIAMVTPYDATDTSITWTSSNEDVAMIADTTEDMATIVAVKTGETTITATANDGSGVSSSFTVTVDGLVDATVVLGTSSSFPTWSSASVFRRSQTPYDSTDPNNLADQYGTVSGTTGSYGVETWVDADGIQWWYCKAKTVQLSKNGTTAFSGMKSKNTIQELYLNEFDTSEVTTFLSSQGLGNGYVNKYNLTYIYYGNGSSYKNIWTALKNIHLDGCDFNKVESMEGLFRGSGLETIDFSVLKDGGSGTRAIKDMNNMFYGCTNLKQVNFGSMNTQSVTNMSYMFYNCTALQTVNMSSFNTIACTNFSYMFSGCTSLQNVTVGSRFTNNAATSLGYIFQNVPTSFNKDCFGWTNGTWNSSGSFTKN